MKKEGSREAERIDTVENAAVALNDRAEIFYSGVALDGMVPVATDKSMAATVT
jgi:hypothetical protein